jgi:uncharacterized Zn finger protein
MMKCPKCGKENPSCLIETNEGFEILESESSHSNWDDLDFWVKIKCKECGNIFEFIQ